MTEETLAILKELRDKLDAMHKQAETDMNNSVGYQHGVATGFMEGLEEAFWLLHNKVEGMEQVQQ